MTSSDVLNTNFAILLVQATDLILQRLDDLMKALDRRATEHAKTPMIKHSHSIHAEPTTFDAALTEHLAEMKRGRARLDATRSKIAVEKIAETVGTYAHLSPALERTTLASLKLSTETVSTQVVARNKHTAYFATLAVVAT